MPVHIDYFPDFDLIYADHVGSITVGDVAHAFADLLAIPGIRSARYVLNDLTRMESLDTFFEGRAAMAEQVAQDAAAMEQPWAISIVYPGKTHRPALLDYARRIREPLGLRCELLKTVEEALDWLEADMAARSLITSSGRSLVAPV